VLNQSDLLIFVWDGDGTRRTGGTVDSLYEAVAYGMPIVWIDALEPTRWRIIHGEQDLGWVTSDVASKPEEPLGNVQALQAIVRAAIEPPPPPHHGSPHQHGQHEPDLRKHYFALEQPKRNWWFGWKFFRGLMAYGKPDLQSIGVQDFVSSARREWPTDPSEDPDATLPPTVITRTESSANEILRPHFAWADRLADFYADRYRTTYVVVFALAAFAVVAAMITYAANGVAWLGSVELLTLGGLLILAIRSRRSSWHEQWLQYRMLAEFVRQIRVLVPIGGGRPFPHTAPPHLGAYGSPDQTWMHWQMRAITRSTGLPSVVVDAKYLRGFLESIDRVARSQQNFHKKNADRSGRIYHHLHVIAAVLVVSTIVIVALHLTLEIHKVEEALQEMGPSGFGSVASRWLLMLSASLPAIGAACAGIENQGEFHRVAKRSHAMDGALGEIRIRIKKLSDAQSISLAQVSTLATDFTTLMTDEVSDWRVMFADRPQSAGG
jgi:hypothetical protein